MYLDKPMRDHGLLQAIARVNRPYKDNDGRRKPCGFVLDFVGLFDKLEKALKFDLEDVEGVIEGLNVLKQRFEQLICEGREHHLMIPRDQKGDKAVEAILEHFRDQEEREACYAFFRELEELHEIISPDPFMRPFIDDFEDLAAMYGLIKGSYDRGVLVDKSFLRKTAQLVRQHTSITEVQRPTKLQTLDAETLTALTEADQPDTVKVFNLLKAIDRLTSQEANREPYLISIGDKAEAIAQAFEGRQATTQETLEQLRRLLQEITEARQERDATKQSAESFAVYWLLRKEGIAQADTVAKAAGQAFEQYPHWQTSSHQEQEVRKAFYKALINAGVRGCSMWRRASCACCGEQCRDSTARET